MDGARSLFLVCFGLGACSRSELEIDPPAGICGSCTDAYVEAALPDAHVDAGLPDAHVDAGLPDAHVDAGCPSGLTECGAACVDLQSDEENCGACGQACTSGVECIDSICTLVGPAGLSKCTAPDGSEYCTDTGSDPENCGACGSSCELPNVETATCVSETCKISACSAGKVDCDSIAATGCECKAAACVTGSAASSCF